MRKLALTAALAFPLAAPVTAATLHTTQAITQCDAATLRIENTILSSTTSSDDVSVIVSPIDGLCTGSASAIATGGRVGVAAFVSGSTFSASPFDASSSAFAELRYTARLKAPIQQAGVAVPVSLNLSLTGDLGGTVARVFDPDTGAELGPSRQTSASLIWKGAISHDGISQTFGDRQTRINTPSDEVFSLLPVELPITTPSVLVKPGETFGFSFSLEAKAGGFLQYTANSASAAALNSLTFAQTGPVFNLPDGYFVEIDEATIQNNRYVPITPAVVPLPAGGFALLLALGGLAALRRRQMA